MSVTKTPNNTRAVAKFSRRVNTSNPYEASSYQEAKEPLTEKPRLFLGKTSGAKAKGACPGLIFQCRRRPFLDVTAPHTCGGSIGDGDNGRDR